MVRVVAGRIAGVESGVNPDRVHSQFEVKVDKSDSYASAKRHIPRLISSRD